MGNTISLVKSILFYSQATYVIPSNDEAVPQCKPLYQEFYKMPGQTAVSVLENVFQAYAKKWWKGDVILVD